ncbi:GDP-fucose transporter 1-like [Babylonia areolata]|uniref:GDP-fucose transporter 1-like n=1 Tax=Babylonia areolata TaxID=304850 RepID=UPI003FD09812
MAAARTLSEVLQPRVVLVILCHWFLAISLIFVNKQLLSAQHDDQDLTIFIAWAQCLFSVITVFVAVVVKRYLRPRSPGLDIDIPLVTFVHSDVLYMTFTFIGIIVMNNLLLRNIGVDFYQVARSSTLVFTVLLSFCVRARACTRVVLFSCTLILLGFMVSVDQEMLVSSLSWASVAYGLFASMAAALNGIFIKRADKQVRGNALNLSLINNVNTVVVLFPLLLTTGQLHSALLGSPQHAISAAAWWQLVGAGVLRLLVGWTAVKVISLTSPVTHHMSINAKSLLQTCIAVVVQDEGKTAVWWAGNLLVVLGILNYGLSKGRHSDLTSFNGGGGGGGSVGGGIGGGGGGGGGATVRKSFFVSSRNGGVLPGRYSDLTSFSGNGGGGVGGVDGGVATVCKSFFVASEGQRSNLAALTPFEGEVFIWKFIIVSARNSGVLSV